MKWSRLFLAITLLAVMWPQAAGAQTKPAPAPAPAPEDDPDRDPNRNQPDFTIVNLPTTLRVPRFKSAFRVTHRFGRPLGAGDFGDLASDMFGLDSGAQIGLEYRFGVIRGGADRHPPHEQQDDRVLRAVQRAGAAQATG